MTKKFLTFFGAVALLVAATLPHSITSEAGGPVVASRLVRRASDPASGPAGAVYFNTTSNLPRFHNGASWSAWPAAGGATTGEQLLSSTTLDVNSTSAQDLYTVPAGKTLVVTRIVARSPSLSIYSVGPGTLNVSFTENGTGGGVASNINVAAFVDAVQVRATVPASASFYSVTAGNKVQATPGSAFGSAATVIVDLFGYLI